jgi:hypothetical protein
MPLPADSAPAPQRAHDSSGRVPQGPDSSGPLARLATTVPAWCHSGSGPEPHRATTVPARCHNGSGPCHSDFGPCHSGFGPEPQRFRPGATQGHYGSGPEPLWAGMVLTQSGSGPKELALWTIGLECAAPTSASRSAESSRLVRLGHEQRLPGTPRTTGHEYVYVGDDMPKFPEYPARQRRIFRPHSRRAEQGPGQRGPRTDAGGSPRARDHAHGRRRLARARDHGG